MTLESAKRLAQANANQHRIAIAIVDAPVENAEDESGPYGFAPVAAVRTLFPRGKIVEKVQPELPGVRK